MQEEVINMGRSPESGAIQSCCHEFLSFRCSRLRTHKSDRVLGGQVHQMMSLDLGEHIVVDLRNRHPPICASTARELTGTLKGKRPIFVTGLQIKKTNRNELRTCGCPPSAFFSCTTCRSTPTQSRRAALRS